MRNHIQTLALFAAILFASLPAAAAGPIIADHGVVFNGCGTGGGCSITLVANTYTASAALPNYVGTSNTSAVYVHFSTAGGSNVTAFKVKITAQYGTSPFGVFGLLTTGNNDTSAGIVVIEHVYTFSAGNSVDDVIQFVNGQLTYNTLVNIEAVTSGGATASTDIAQAAIVTGN